jgi:hypothetical protein
MSIYILIKYQFTDPSSPEIERAKSAENETIKSSEPPTISSRNIMRLSSLDAIKKMPIMTPGLSYQDFFKTPADITPKNKSEKSEKKVKTKSNSFMISSVFSSSLSRGLRDEIYTLESYKSERVIPYDVGTGGDDDIDVECKEELIDYARGNHLMSENRSKFENSGYDKDTISDFTSDLVMTERVIHSVISLIVIAQVFSNNALYNIWIGSQELGSEISQGAKALLDIIPLKTIQELSKLVAKPSTGKGAPRQETCCLPLQRIALVMRGIIGTPPFCYWYTFRL